MCYLGDKPRSGGTHMTFFDDLKLGRWQVPTVAPPTVRGRLAVVPVMMSAVDDSRSAKSFAAVACSPHVRKQPRAGVRAIGSPASRLTVRTRALSV